MAKTRTSYILLSAFLAVLLLQGVLAAPQEYADAAAAANAAANGGGSAYGAADAGAYGVADGLGGGSAMAAGAANAYGGGGAAGATGLANAYGGAGAAGLANAYGGAGVPAGYSYPLMPAGYGSAAAQGIANANGGAGGAANAYGAASAAGGAPVYSPGLLVGYAPSRAAGYGTANAYGGAGGGAAAAASAAAAAGIDYDYGALVEGPPFPLDNSLGAHLQVVKRVIHDIIALAANSIGLVPASMSLGGVSAIHKMARIRFDLHSLQESYFRLLMLVQYDLATTMKMLSRLPGFGLVRFALHVPVTIIEAIKSFLYRVLHALGLAY